MFSSGSSVKRPILYFVAAALAVALAVPLAASSGQMKTGGIFDECFGSDCNNTTMLATAD